MKCNSQLTDVSYFVLGGLSELSGCPDERVPIKRSRLYNRIAVGMGIPIPLTYGWEWERIPLQWEFPRGKSHGNSHVGNPMGILWESCREILWESCGNSHVGNPMGIPTEILWEWDGNWNSVPTAILLYNAIFSLIRHPKFVLGINRVDLAVKLSKRLVWDQTIVIQWGSPTNNCSNSKIHPLESYLHVSSMVIMLISLILIFPSILSKKATWYQENLTVHSFFISLYEQSP